MNEPHSHLVILQHGNHGRADDLSSLEQELHQALCEYIESEDANYHYLRPESNEGNNTHDGIVTLATRVLKEMDAYIHKSLPPEGRIYITMVAHSLGILNYLLVYVKSMSHKIYL